MAALSRRIVTCSSLSKSHGAPGLRTGWLTTTDPELYERLRVAKFNSLICGSGPDELLSSEVLRRRDSILGARRELLGATARRAPGAWFGESDRVFRVGFGHLPMDVFEEALQRLAEAMSSTASAPQPLPVAGRR